MHKTLSLKRLMLLGVMAWLLIGASVAFAQEATTVPAEGETVSEAADHAEADTGEVVAEAEAGGGGLDALGLNAGYLLAQIINFLIIFGALGALLWRPIINMLDARSAKIEKGLEDARIAAEARRNAEAEAEKILAAARADVSKVIEEGRGRGEEVVKQLEADARAEAEKIRADARIAAAAERDQQLAALRGQVADISIAVARRLIGESLDAKRQNALISDFFTKVPAEARKLGGDVEIVSAMPLSADEQAKARQEIGAGNVTFTVDPSILGGLIVRSGDRVVDGSIRSSLNDLAGRLN
jgi:F-type H+-transporting ATPase subunit b